MKRRRYCWVIEQGQTVQGRLVGNRRHGQRAVVTSNGLNVLPEEKVFGLRKDAVSALEPAELGIKTRLQELR